MARRRLNARALGIAAALVVLTGCAWLPVRTSANPLRAAGPLRGAALVGALPGALPEALWADRPDEATRVRSLDQAMRQARPAPDAAAGACGPLEGATLELLPARGAEIDVDAVWSCQQTSGGPTGVRSPDLIAASSAGRSLGVFRAPGLAAAMVGDQWPHATDPPLAVQPAACPPGCALTVVGNDVLVTTVTLKITTDAGSRTLGTVNPHDGHFTWSGRLPAGLPPGNALIGAGTLPGAPVTLLPAGMAAPVITTDPGSAVSAPLDARLPGYPPPASTAPDQEAAVATAGSALAAADGRTVLRSADGGRTWTAVHTFAGARVSGVSLVGATSGWATLDGPPCPTASACLVVTVDGGRTWKPGDGAPAGATAVRFFSGTQGVVITAGGAVDRTTDGGRTWVPWGIVPWWGLGRIPVPVDFGSPDFGVASLPGGPAGPALATTTDGGRDWAVRPVAARAIVSISTPGAGVIWMLAQTCATTAPCATLERSVDGGATWSAVDMGPALGADLPGRRFQILADSATAAWLLLPGRVALHTADGGRTWSLPVAG